MAKAENPMRQLRISKVTVNMAVGRSGERLAKASKVLEELVGQKPSFRAAKKTIKDFGIKKGENIACVVTLRGQKAINFLKDALSAIDYKVKASSFDEYGNFAFGVKEHISLPNVKYDPDLGIFGFDVCVSIERPGYRVARRRRKRSTIGANHRVSKEEAIRFVKEALGVTII